MQFIETSILFESREIVSEDCIFHVNSGRRSQVECGFANNCVLCEAEAIRIWSFAPVGSSETMSDIRVFSWVLRW